MPTIPSIQSYFKSIAVFEEYPAKSVFVVFNDEVKSVKVSDISDLDNDYYYIGHTGEFDKYSKYPQMPIIGLKKRTVEVL